MTKQQDKRIEELEKQKYILERTINESLNVMLNSLDNDALLVNDLNAVISVTIGNMFWGLKQAGVIDD